MIGSLPARVWVLVGRDYEGRQASRGGSMIKRMEAAVFMFHSISSHRNIHTHNKHALFTQGAFVHARTLLEQDWSVRSGLPWHHPVAPSPQYP